MLELIRPWRREQPVVRQQLGLDIFYMFFNMFIFPLMGYATASYFLAVEMQSWELIQKLRGIVPLQNLPAWSQIVILFVVRDFVQWGVHVTLHRVPFLWQLHQVHHSAEVMSFPVHLRYHWAENIIYAIPEYLIFMALGRGVHDLFIIYATALIIGHLNHANFKLPWGFLKYIFNTSELHLWHHAKNPPKQYGVNFALSLSIWDWLFKTAYNPPEPPRAIGLAQDSHFPKSFWRQLIWPYKI